MSAVAACPAEGGRCARGIRRAAQREEGGREDGGARHGWQSAGAPAQLCCATLEQHQAWYDQ